MSYAVLFPGQGSQFVGMGQDLFLTRPDLLGNEADSILGWSLSDVCLEGTVEALTATDKAQPALFAVSYALWTAFKDKVPTAPVALAGHSLGEYTALAAAGSMDYFTGLSLVSDRGIAMAEAAADAEPSTMAAVVGSPDDVVERVLADRREQGGRIWTANFNAPGQVVVAGSSADIEWLGAEARTLGLRRVIPLTVGGAFHSPYMEPAGRALAGSLAGVDFAMPERPVYSNVSAAPVTDVQESLVSQLTAPVRFAETLQAMAQAGIDTFVHVGPGDVTAGLARKTIKEATVVVVDTLDSIAEAVARLADVGGPGE